jgi:hypothetical protein
MLYNDGNRYYGQWKDDMVGFFSEFGTETGFFFVSRSNLSSSEAVSEFSTIVTASLCITGRGSATRFVQFN